MSARAASADLGGSGRVVETMIPKRLDGLPWSRWRWTITFTAARARTSAPLPARAR
jgi:hypothetical protein